MPSSRSVAAPVLAHLNSPPRTAVSFCRPYVTYPHRQRRAMYVAPSKIFRYHPLASKQDPILRLTLIGRQVFVYSDSPLFRVKEVSPLLQVLAYPCAHPSRLLFPNNFHLAVVNRVSAYPRWPLYFIQFHSGSSSSSKAIALLRFPKSKRHQFHPYLSPLRLGTLQPPIQHSIRKIMSLFPSRLHALSIRNKSITLPCHPSRNTLPSMARGALSSSSVPPLLFEMQDDLDCISPYPVMWGVRALESVV